MILCVFTNEQHRMGEMPLLEPFTLRPYPQIEILTGGLCAQLTNSVSVGRVSVGTRRKPAMLPASR